VFSGSFTVGSYTCQGLEFYDGEHIALSTNFWYDPRAGNLLLDVRLYQGIAPPPIPPFDAVDVAGDSVSRVWADSVSATSGTTDTTGLVTFFAMAPPPTLQTYITTTNYMAIRWFAQPSGFVLQQSSSLGSVAVWQSLPGAGGTNPSGKEYLVPITSAGTGVFFRLAIPGGR
jgi:hypothetical protein